MQALVQIMAWRRPGDKPLSETMMISLLTHVCVTRPVRKRSDLFQNSTIFKCSKLHCLGKKIILNLIKAWPKCFECLVNVVGGNVLVKVRCRHLMNQKPAVAEISEWRVNLQRVVIISSPPSDAYMRQWMGSALVQIMACRLFGAKPLSEPMLGYY